MLVSDVILLVECIVCVFMICFLIRLWRSEKNIQEELRNNNSCFPQRRGLRDYCVITKNPPKDKSKFWFNSQNNMFYYFDFITNKWVEMIK